MTGLKFQYGQGVRWHESQRLVFGQSPPAIGNLDQLPALDLCCRKLPGTFPPNANACITGTNWICGFTGAHGWTAA